MLPHTVNMRPRFDRVMAVQLEHLFQTGHGIAVSHRLAVILALRRQPIELEQARGRGMERNAVQPGGDRGVADGERPVGDEARVGEPRLLGQRIEVPPLMSVMVFRRDTGSHSALRMHLVGIVD